VTEIREEDGWKPLPLVESGLKGVLLAVLDYLGGRSDDNKREEILRARKLLSKMSLPPERILLLLREIEREEGLKIGLEV